jgi:hypothetical protein
MRPTIAANRIELFVAMQPSKAGVCLAYVLKEALK